MTERGRVFLANSLLLALAAAATVFLGLRALERPAPTVLRPGLAAEETVLDASGYAVPRAAYRRIVSTSLFTDRILVELVPVDRILALSTESRTQARFAPTLRVVHTVEAFGPVEALLTLRPDLVLMPSHGTPARAKQLRDAGVAVFELGELHGLATLKRTALLLGDLLDAAPAADRFLRAVAVARATVEARRGDRPEPRGMYLSIMGSGLQGGTVGTSFHDILALAGVEDAAAGRFTGWPTYTAENVLSLGVRVIVTREGMAAALCRHPGMEHAPACGARGRIVELPGNLLDDPGASVIEAAGLLARALFP